MAERPWKRQKFPQVEEDELFDWMEAKLMDAQVQPEQAKAVTAVFRSMRVNKVALSKSTPASLDYALQGTIADTDVRKGIVFRLHNWISEHTPEPAPLLQYNMLFAFPDSAVFPILLVSFPK